MQTNLNLIQQNKEITKLLSSLNEEIHTLGYYNPHKFQKEYKFNSNTKFETIIETIKNNGYQISRPHNNRLGIKTNCPSKEFIKIMKNKTN